MTTPVARQGESGVLRSLTVGSAVSRAHGLRAVNDLSHLLAFAGPQPVYQGHPYVSVTTPPFSYAVGYVRSPGVFALLVRLTLNGDTSTSSARVSVATSSGSIAWINQGELDGVHDLHAINTAGLSIADAAHTAVMDVSGLPVGTPVTLTFAVSSPIGCYGLDWLRVVEIPRSVLSPELDPATEIGLDGSWPAPWNRLLSGDPATQAFGVRRWVQQLKRAKNEFRRHLQLVAPDHNNQPWQIASGTYTNVWKSVFSIRAKRIGKSGTFNSWNVRVLYRTSNGSTSGNLRVTQGSNTAVAALPASTTLTAAAEPTLTIDTGTTDQEVDLTLEIQRTAGAGTVYVPTVLLYENEP